MVLIICKISFLSEQNAGSSSAFLQIAELALFHGLPIKSKRSIASSLSSQLILLLFSRNRLVERDIQQTYFCQYFCKLLENSCGASKKRSENFQKVHKKTPLATSYFSKVVGFYRSCPEKKAVLLERCLQNSQESNCVRDSILIKLQA